MGSTKCFVPVYGLHLVTILVFLIHRNPTSAVGPVPECGTIDEVLAQHDSRAQAPWTAALYFQSTQCDFRPAGNGHGVILGPTTVLLRGNFLWSSDAFGGFRMESYSPNHFMMAVGLKSKVPLVADQHTQFLKVANIQPHYKSYSPFSQHDYAIVHLKNPIQFSSFVRPICVDILPEGMFERSNDSLVNEHLTISGYRIGSGNIKSAVHTDKEPFGILSSEFCKSKLESDLLRSSSALNLLDADTPCGVSTKGIDDLIDVRTVGLSKRGEMIIAFLRKLLNFPYSEAAKGPRPIPNMCYHNGAAIVTMYQGKWHLVGIVTESLGISCEKNMYFVSFVASKDNLNWILQHLRHSPSGFVCSNGQNVDLESSLCNGSQDCGDGSDEDSKLCACAPLCGNTNCVLQPMCKYCSTSDSLKILSNTFKFSSADTPKKKTCPPVFPPADTAVYCKSYGSRLPCDRHHYPETQAVFSCQHFDSSTPAAYCVTTCKEDGEWSNELSSFKCQPKPLIEDIPITITERSNFSISSLPPPPNDGHMDMASIASMRLTTTRTVYPDSSEVKDHAHELAIKYTNITGTMWCPALLPTMGTAITCISPSTSKPISCSEPLPPGTIAEFTCKRYYRPVLSTLSVDKECNMDGQWSLNNRHFECRLDCGIPKKNLVGHIVNGQETDGTKWPWHGLIFTYVGHHNLTYICGSTLISKRILITAAHCVSDRQGKLRDASMFKVALAATSNIYHKTILDADVQIFDVSNIVVHPHFNIENFEADIAIIQLARPSEINDYVRPACYPATLGTHAEFKHLSPGSIGKVVGFGVDESGKPSKTLNEASLPVVSYKDCFEVSKIQHSSTQYCSGYTNGTSACNGDSGGGHFFEVEVLENKIYLQGIVSHGNKDESTRLCDHNQYSVFTRVSSFKNWISKVGYELDEEF